MTSLWRSNRLRAGQLCCRAINLLTTNSKKDYPKHPIQNLSKKKKKKNGSQVSHSWWLCHLVTSATSVNGIPTSDCGHGALLRQFSQQSTWRKKKKENLKKGNTKKGKYGSKRDNNYFSFWFFFFCGTKKSSWKHPHITFFQKIPLIFRRKRNFPLRTFFSSSAPFSLPYHILWSTFLYRLASQ